MIENILYNPICFLLFLLLWPLGAAADLYFGLSLSKPLSYPSSSPTQNYHFRFFHNIKTSLQLSFLVELHIIIISIYSTYFFFFLGGGGGGAR